MRICALALALVAAATPAASQEIPEWVQKTKISGLMFGDVYAVVAHHDPDVEDQNGMWFRRIYLTVDHKQSSKFSARLRLESVSPGGFDTTDRLLLPFVKDAYLKWKYTGEHSAIIGVSSTPTWNLIEPFWGYRHVEKTPLDMARFAGSRELGLAFKGKFGDGGKFGYHAMLANGGDTNPGKRILGSLSMAPTEGVILEAYADYDNRADDTDIWTLQGFVGYAADWGRLGGQIARQALERGGAPDLKLDIVSGFAIIALKNDMDLVLRIDQAFDPNPRGDDIQYIPMSPDADALFFLAGLDFEVTKFFSIVPNIEIVTYSDPVAGVETPDSDVYLRGTFFWKF
jgi:hypothetical protein